MAYVEDDDVQERVGGLKSLIELTDDEHIGAVDYEILDHYILRTVGKVEAWLAGVTEVPITDSLKLARIEGPILDLINYDLKARRDVVNDADEQLYKDALAFFTALGGKTTSISDTSNAGRVVTRYESPLIWTRGTMRGL